uniref:Protein KTI12 homolog n=1 Tax=Culicoides sonorensis TaxID=179676 RepID=A0A336MYV6_CULSO
MPLIIISGLPSSGKSTRAKELKQYFEGSGKKVHVVSENFIVPKGGHQKNDYFADSQKEKMGRADLKSEALRLLTPSDVVILDAGNYIKGYRYELYCASKETRNNKCTLFCGITKEQAWEFNQKRNVTSQDLNCDVDQLDNSFVAYTQEIFDLICQRFEEPQSNNRWDSPLFVSFPDDKLDFEGIEASIFSKKPPKPNQSTQSAPLSATNYMFELDQMTQDIVSQVVSARKVGCVDPILIKGQQNLKIEIRSDVTVSELNRCRRQYLNFIKQQSGTVMAKLDQAPGLFVQFLNTNCS